MISCQLSIEGGGQRYGHIPTHTIGQTSGSAALVIFYVNKYILHMERQLRNGDVKPYSQYQRLQLLRSTKDFGFHSTATYPTPTTYRPWPTDCYVQSTAAPGRLPRSVDCRAQLTAVLVRLTCRLIRSSRVCPGWRALRLAPSPGWWAARGRRRR